MKKNLRTPDNIALAKQLNAQGLPRHIIGERFGVSESTIRAWIDPEKYAIRVAQAMQWQKDNKTRVNELAKARNATRTFEQKDAISAYQRHRYATNPKTRAKFRRLALKHRLTAQGYMAQRVRMATLSYSSRIHPVYHSLMQAVSGLSKEAFTARFMGEGQMDHIIPLCSFDLTNSQHLVRAMHYSNVRLIGRIENQRKGDAGRLENVHLLPWVRGTVALAAAQAFISRALASLQRNQSKHAESEADDEPANN